MASLNKVFLIGNLTRDPEIRRLDSGTTVAKFGLAVNRNYSTASGERREETTFVDVTAWGRQAEVIGQYLSKGRPVFVEGRLRLDSWTAQDGTKRNKLEVVLENFQFLGSRGDAGGQGARAGGASYATAGATASEERALAGVSGNGSAAAGSLGLAEEDIPF